MRLLQRLLLLFVFVQVVAAVFAGTGSSDTIMRWLVPGCDSVDDYLPGQVSLFMASAILYYVLGASMRWRPGGGTALKYLLPVRAEKVDPKGNRFLIEGTLKPYSTVDNFETSLTDFAVAQTWGWAPKILCGLLALASVVWFLPTQTPRGALVAVVPLIILALLFFGRIQVCVASGHVASYYGFRCAEKARVLAREGIAFEIERLREQGQPPPAESGPPKVLLVGASPS